MMGRGGEWVGVVNKFGGFDPSANYDIHPHFLAFHIPLRFAL